MGDREGFRHQQAVRMPPLQHRADLVPVEPAAGFEFDAVEDDLRARRQSQAADHEIGGKGPGLAAVIGHLADPDAGFLEGFAAHRIVERLAGLDETSEAGPEFFGKLRLAAEDAAAGAVMDQHDRHRIDAWEDDVAAGRAAPAHAARLALGLSAAARAKTVGAMPEKEMLGLAEPPFDFGRQNRLHGEGAQIDRLDVVAQALPARKRRRDMGPARRVPAEENRLPEIG